MENNQGLIVEHLLSPEEKQLLEEHRASEVVKTGVPSDSVVLDTETSTGNSIKFEKRDLTSSDGRSINTEQLKKYLDAQQAYHRKVEAKRKKLEDIRKAERLLLQSKRMVREKMAKDSRKKNRKKR